MTRTDTVHHSTPPDNVDLITVAELLGHARVDTTRAYSRPTQEDRAGALKLLDIDQ